MDIEKKEVKVEVKAEPAKAPVVAAKKAPAAKKPAAKKAPAKKATAAKKVEIFFQIDGQEISNAAIAKKLPKAAKIWVNAAEKKAYDESGKGVDLF